MVYTLMSNSHFYSKGIKKYFSFLFCLVCFLVSLMKKKSLAKTLHDAYLTEALIIVASSAIIYIIYRLLITRYAKMKYQLFYKLFFKNMA